MFSMLDSSSSCSSLTVYSSTVAICFLLGILWALVVSSLRCLSLRSSSSQKEKTFLSFLVLPLNIIVIIDPLLNTAIQNASHMNTIDLIYYQMYLTRKLTNLAPSVTHKPSFYGSSKPTKRHRDKFKLDHEYYNNIPLDQRDDELERINSLRKLNVQFMKKIPYYPINEYWNYHGTKLMTHTWEPPKNVRPKAVLIFFHSLNGHTGTSGELASHLVGDGYIMTGYDFVNFGQSQGTRRGCIQSFDELVSTSEQFIIRVKQQYPNLNVFVSGMSLGGAVAFHVLLKNPNIAKGAIFFSPSLRQNKMHFPLLKKLTILLSMFLPYQQLLKQTGRNGSRYRLDTYSDNDPFLYHGRLYPRTVSQLLMMMARTRKEFRNFRAPYLVIQSGCDKLVDPFACLDLQKTSPSHDKTTVIIHDMWHAIWLDDHMPDIIKIVQEWLNQRV